MVDHILGQSGPSGGTAAFLPGRAFLLSCSEVPASVMSTLTWRHLEVLEVLCLFSAAKLPWMPARLSWLARVSGLQDSERTWKVSQRSASSRAQQEVSYLHQLFGFFRVVVELLGNVSQLLLGVSVSCVFINSSVVPLAFLNNASCVFILQKLNNRSDLIFFIPFYSSFHLFIGRIVW